METIERSNYILSALNSGSNCTVFTEDIIDVQKGTLEVNGEGKINIRNTGGSSASEGGMGSGNDDDREKGDLSKPGEKSGTPTTKDDEGDTTFDPIKKNIKEAEKSSDKD
jgi:hypothetical protein